LSRTSRPSNVDQLGLFEMAENVAISARDQLTDLCTYGKGASEEIRAAVLNPDDGDVQKNVMMVLNGLVMRIKTYFELAQRLEKVIPLLLWELCSGPLPPAEHLEANEALCKQLSHLIDFVLRFDCVKMNTPALQNDFSYYRRLISRDQVFDSQSCLAPDMAGALSLFLASPTPMLTTLISSVDQFHRLHVDLALENTTETLATIIQVLQFMLQETVNDDDDETMNKDTEFWLRVMVGCILLFDHVDPDGAFHRSSIVDIRMAVRLIKSCARPHLTTNLMNTLRYTTKHLNHSTTPKTIRALFVD